MYKEHDGTYLQLGGIIGDIKTLYPLNILKITFLHIKLAYIPFLNNSLQGILHESADFLAHLLK